PTPAAGFVVGVAPSFTSHPANATVFVGGMASLSATVSGSGVVLQWRFNGAIIPGATTATLLLSNLTLANAGTYNLAAFNNAGSAISSNAQLAVLAPVTITTQPGFQSVQPGASVTNTVAAIGNGTLRYQWQFEGVDIPNATNASYSFT